VPKQQTGFPYSKPDDNVSLFPDHGEPLSAKIRQVFRLASHPPDAFPALLLPVALCLLSSLTAAGPRGNHPDSISRRKLRWLVFDSSTYCVYACVVEFLAALLSSLI